MDRSCQIGKSTTSMRSQSVFRMSCEAETGLVGIVLARYPNHVAAQVRRHPVGSQRRVELVQLGHRGLEPPRNGAQQRAAPELLRGPSDVAFGIAHLTDSVGG